jgi:hypothetical protein
MRALRVLGLAEDGENLVCEDGTSGELFTLPSDERLRAATRGDLSRLGQLQIELEPQLRPREIQARIRSGSSIAEVAIAASTSVSRIERYAYPVLLERSTMAEKARLAHPTIDGNPTRKTLEELVMSTLAERGQDTGVRWDAYRDDDGWVVSLRWQAGRSENQAFWEVHSAQRTTTLHPKDDVARDLIDPAPRSLRTLGGAKSNDAAMADVARRINDAARAAAQPGFPQPGFAQPGFAQPELPQRGPISDATARPDHGADDRAIPTAGSRHPAGTRRALSDRLDQEQMVEQTVLDQRAGTQPPAPKPEPARTGTDSAPSRGHRKGRPVMPGWEDVLLGGGQTPTL